MKTVTTIVLMVLLVFTQMEIVPTTNTENSCTVASFMNNPEISISRLGTKIWRLGGERHREDGPAVIYANGSVEYWQNGQLHRLDGPAIMDADGLQEHFQYNLIHREDGPAVIHPDGSVEYWVNDRIPTVFDDMIITNRPMIFDGMLVTEVKYYGSIRDYHAYRFDDMDEFSLAALYYSN